MKKGIKPIYYDRKAKRIIIIMKLLTIRKTLRKIRQRLQNSSSVAETKSRAKATNPKTKMPKSMNICFVVYCRDGSGVQSFLESLDQQVTEFFSKKNPEHFHLRLHALLVGDTEVVDKSVLEEQLHWKDQIQIEIIKASGTTLPKAYNHILSQLNSSYDYITFVQESSCYVGHALLLSLSKIITAKKNIPEKDKLLLAINAAFVKPEGDRVYPPFKINGHGLHLIKAEDGYEVSLILETLFIKPDLLKDLFLVETYEGESSILFAAEIISRVVQMDSSASIYRIGGRLEYTHALPDVAGHYVPKHEVSWYIETLHEVYEPYLKEHLSDFFIQGIIFYLVAARIQCNINLSDTEILKGEELDTFFEEFYHLTDQMALAVLTRTIKIKGMVVPYFISYKCLEHKRNKSNGAITFMNQDGIAIYDSGAEKSSYWDFSCSNFLEVSAINKSQDHLVIELRDKRTPVGFHELCGAVYTAEYDLTEIQIYNEVRSLGQVIHKVHIYQWRIPIEELLSKHDPAELCVYINVGGIKHPVKLRFDTSRAARLSASLPSAYWLFDVNKVLTYNSERKTLSLQTVTKEDALAMEERFRQEIQMCDALSGEEKESILSIRASYWKYFWEEPHKNIWITYDKLYKGGDNGEYIYHYLREHCPDVDAYYIINTGTKDYERLKNDTHVLVYDTDECREICAKANVFLSTHSGSFSSCGFRKPKYKKYCKDIVNADEVCIQHGLTIQNIANYQNRLKYKLQFQLEHFL